MRAKQVRIFLCILQQKNLGRKFGASKLHLSPPPPPLVALTAVRSKAAVLLLLIYCFMYLPLFVGFCVGHCFGMHYFMSFLILQQGRES